MCRFILKMIQDRAIIYYYVLLLKTFVELKIRMKYTKCAKLLWNVNRNLYAFTEPS